MRQVRVPGMVSGVPQDERTRLLHDQFRGLGESRPPKIPIHAVARRSRVDGRVVVAELEDEIRSWWSVYRGELRTARQSADPMERSKARIIGAQARRIVGTLLRIRRAGRQAA
ncbi:MAG: hypothetical protein WD739_07545 [Actinomycetota bacterium]